AVRSMLDRSTAEQGRPKSSDRVSDVWNFAVRDGGSSNLRPPSMLEQARHRKVSIADLARGSKPAADPEGTLQPTLVIGLGRFGVRMGEGVRDALATQFGEAAHALPIQVMHVDVDPTTARLTNRADGNAFAKSPLAVCRLRKGAEYRAEWDQSKHISSWLDQ